MDVNLRRRVEYTHNITGDRELWPYISTASKHKADTDCKESTSPINVNVGASDRANQHAVEHTKMIWRGRVFLVPVHGSEWPLLTV